MPAALDISYDSLLLDTTKVQTSSPSWEKPPEQQPNKTLSVALKEELRQRLYLIKSRLLNLTTDQDDQYLAINDTFNHELFKLVVIHAANVSLEQSEDDGSELLIYLKFGKSQQARAVIERFGSMFLEELNHFMRMNASSIMRRNSPKSFKEDVI